MFQRHGICSSIKLLLTCCQLNTSLVPSLLMEFYLLSNLLLNNSRAFDRPSKLAKKNFLSERWIIVFIMHSSQLAKGNIRIGNNVILAKLGRYKFRCGGG